MKLSVNTKKGIKTLQQRLENIKKQSALQKAYMVYSFAEDAKKRIDDRIVQKDIIDTGKLKRQVTANYDGNFRVEISSLAVNEFGNDYAPLQEFGSRNHRPRPYFWPGIREALDTVRKLKDKIINKLRS